MTTAVFDVPDGQLTLSRPGATSLRAWDAADELLVDAAFRRLDGIENPRVLVVDDQFGALTLGLQALDPLVVADSAVFRDALAYNARTNPRASVCSFVHSWLNPPEGPFDAVVLRIPRQSDYLAWLLHWINDVLVNDGVVIAGGMIKHLPDRSVDIFAQSVHTEDVCPAKKKARVIICRRGEVGLTAWQGAWKGYVLEGTGLSVEGLPAVFAREKLDIGTRLLLPHIREAVSGLAPEANVLDLACGNGVVGLSALLLRSDLALTFSDVSSQAVASARHNVSVALPNVRPVFEHVDGIPGTSSRFERIFLNPPFHEGGAVGDHIALRLFDQASRHLAPLGRLLVVGNRHLGYHRSLHRFFPQVRQLDASPKFVIFEAGLN
ncbi:methyltransferase [Marinobacter salinus]|uniref:Methyltransferase n=1 Tax=Marinobacter salinus TaxID=1874317 RepID=A0A1D9GI19_9GAMM|nr:methyltransferase [Marinobacter salinus]AOY87253.1 methyltransferase [Marinobacter salinus]